MGQAIRISSNPDLLKEHQIRFQFSDFLPGPLEAAWLVFGDERNSMKIPGDDFQLDDRPFDRRGGASQYEEKVENESGLGSFRDPTEILSSVLVTPQHLQTQMFLEAVEVAIGVE